MNLNNNFEIEKEIVSIPPRGNAADHIEVNLLSWNDRKAKLDIRKWSNDGHVPYRGIQMTNEEAAVIAQEILRYLGVNA